MAKNTDHIVLNCMRGGRLECLHCGETFPLHELLPLSVNMVSAIQKAFRKEHCNCKLTELGKMLQKQEEEYFENSKVKFVATQDQLFELVNKFSRHTYTREEFEATELSFLDVAIYPLEEENSYYFLKQAYRAYKQDFADLGIKLI